MSALRDLIEALATRPSMGAGGVVWAAAAHEEGCEVLVEELLEARLQVHERRQGATHTAACHAVRTKLAQLGHALVESGASGLQVRPLHTCFPVQLRGAARRVLDLSELSADRLLDSLAYCVWEQRTGLGASYAHQLRAAYYVHAARARALPESVRAVVEVCAELMDIPAPSIVAGERLAWLRHEEVHADPGSCRKLVEDVRAGHGRVVWCGEFVSLTELGRGAASSRAVPLLDDAALQVACAFLEERDPGTSEEVAAVLSAARDVVAAPGSEPHSSTPSPP